LPNRWDDAGVTTPSVILEDGIYKMWYDGYDGNTFYIGHATSEDGIHWTKYEGNPIIYPGPADSWDDYGGNFGAPSVILDNGVYRMWYYSYDGIRDRIGYATSEDGIHWTKYAGNPVLHEGPQGTWDGVDVFSPSVTKDNGIYKMWYVGSDRTNYRIGYATSSPTCELPPDVTTNTLAITGTVYTETGEVAKNGLPVEVNIITQNLTETDVTGETAGDGQYSVTFFNVDKPVAKEGDEIIVTVKDAEGKLVGQSRHTLTVAEVEAKATIIDVIPDAGEIQFTIKLSLGINLISIPVKLKSWRMSDLAEYIGKENLSMIIRYDDTRRRFISYLPAFPDDAPANSPVECGMGYIVVMKMAKEVVFEGNACKDEIAAPSLIPSMLSSDNQSTSIFVVTGNVRQKETGRLLRRFASRNDIALNGVAVKIRNLRTGQTVYDVTGTLAGCGNYVATFVASEEEFMTHAMDKLEITARDVNHRLTMEPVIYTLTSDEISDWSLIMPLRLSLPKQSVLLQNYPNPFNPETWLPYQLAQDSDVTISIYNIKGQFIRTLNLGSRNAGVYTTKDRAAYWDGRDNSGQPVASGAYFYTLRTGEFRSTRKMVIVK